MGGLDSIAVKVVGGGFEDLPDVAQDNALLEALVLREKDGAS